MWFFGEEGRRYLYTLFRLIPVGLYYRSDRKEILKNKGKIVNPQKYSKHARYAVSTFIKLGPAYIKLGQLLSVRPDFLPQPYIEEFSKLQDEVPPAPFEQVKNMIEKELGPIDKVFDEFHSEAVTGASLGQVYFAKYKGKDVMVKVNRPNVRERVKLDIAVMRRFIPLVGRFIDESLKFSLESIIEQFADTVNEEVDYRNEANNLVLIKTNLKGDKNVIIPNYYPEVSTDKVLVLEKIDGIKVSDIESLDKAGVDRRRLARRVARLFFKMLLSQELFHADPHPGNIAISEDGKIILYDFGMAGRLDEETRIKLIQFYVALSKFDAKKIVDIMLELGVLQPTANRYVIRAGVELALAEMKGKRIENSEVRALMEVANRTIFQFPFKLPKNLVLYMRMLSILEGVCLKLDENFRFIHILGRLLEEEGLTREASRAELMDFLNKVRDSAEAAIEVAPMLKEFLESNNIKQKPSDRSKPRLFFAGVLGGLGIAGILFYFYQSRDPIGYVMLVVSLLLIVASLLLAK
ncbi:MAG: AarF/ABC1/UbiB kinase family protein [Conexivisphaerales archaeon]